MAQPEKKSTQPAKALLGTSWHSRMFFQFISPVISMARVDEQLEQDAVPQHTMNLDTKLLYEAFDSERLRQQTKESPKIWKALMAGRWRILSFTAFGYLCVQGLTLVGPMLLKEIVEGLTCRDTPDDPDCDGTERRLYMYVPSYQPPVP